MSDTMTTPDAATPAGRPALWTVTPGWGIAADLIPTELLKARQIARLRRWIAAGLVVLVLACGGGYFLVARDNSAAAGELADVQMQTTVLQAQSRTYADVVAIQKSVDKVRTQIAQVMAGDVDLVALMGQFQTTLPATMAITQQAITVSVSGVAGATAAPSGLDRSGATRIGTVTMSGTGRTLDDLSRYVDSLQAIPGVVDVVPLANTLSTEGTGTQFSLSLALTDALLSHRYDMGG